MRAVAACLGDDRVRVRTRSDRSTVKQEHWSVVHDVSIRNCSGDAQIESESSSIDVIDGDLQASTIRRAVRDEMPGICVSVDAGEQRRHN